jgi:AcrR family transcriptional regulator
MKNRAIIIRRALQLFRRHGIKSMSVERLTKALNLSRRALYAMFGDKEGLLAACLNLNYREEIIEFDKINQRGTDPIEVLLLVGHRVMEREFSLNPNFYYDILHYYPDLRDKAIRNQDNFNRRQLTGLIQAGIEQGLIRECIDARLASEAIIRLYESLLKAGLDEELNYTKTELVQQAIHPYLRGLCTETGLQRLKQYQILVSQ